MDTPSNIHQRMMMENKLEIDSVVKKDILMQMENEKLQKYGSVFKIKSQGLEDVCEREVELVEEVFQEKQIEEERVKPIRESEYIDQCALTDDF